MKKMKLQSLVVASVLMSVITVDAHAGFFDFLRNIFGGRRTVQSSQERRQRTSRMRERRSQNVTANNNVASQPVVVPSQAISVADASAQSCDANDFFSPEIAIQQSSQNLSLVGNITLLRQVNGVSDSDKRGYQACVAQNDEVVVVNLNCNPLDAAHGSNVQIYSKRLGQVVGIMTSDDGLKSVVVSRTGINLSANVDLEAFQTAYDSEMQYMIAPSLANANARMNNYVSWRIDSASGDSTMRIGGLGDLASKQLCSVNVESIITQQASLLQSISALTIGAE